MWSSLLRYFVTEKIDTIMYKNADLSYQKAMTLWFLVPGPAENLCYISSTDRCCLTWRTQILVTLHE
jgi:hypothetical protein